MQYIHRSIHPCGLKCECVCVDHSSTYPHLSPAIMRRSKVTWLPVSSFVKFVTQTLLVSFVLKSYLTRTFLILRNFSLLRMNKTMHYELEKSNFTAGTQFRKQYIQGRHTSMPDWCMVYGINKQ